MNLNSDNLTFRDRSGRSNPVRLLIWGILIVAGVWMVFQIQVNKTIEPLFLPTATPTRTAFSLTSEGEFWFESGDLGKAITAYEQAIALDPNNADPYIALARIETYSSALLTTDQEGADRMNEAKAHIDKGVELAPDNSSARAVKAFVLDWMANPNYGYSENEIERFLNEAQQEAGAALLLDSQNTLALAYSAEVYMDQLQWDLAQNTIQAALNRDVTIMDVHRIHGQILETFGRYRDAIDAYDRAAALSPNMTFLYIYIGLNYRQLEVYDRALEYFDRAARINEKNGVQDPIPYIAIAKTYVQQGEFFAAARNAEKALILSPTNPNTYGQLGDIYVRARNYEGALPVLKCAVYGCTGEENEASNRLLDQAIAIEGLPLSSIEVAYYYVRYGTVLASLDQCDLAEPVLDDVTRAYGGDPIIAAIVADTRGTCRLLNAP